MRPGLVPPIHEIGEYVFEDLCRDLAQEEESVETAEIYGLGGCQLILHPMQRRCAQVRRASSSP